MANENSWGSNVEFFLTLLSYTVGVSNIWRFPYLCMRNGGGSFLLPYLTCLILCAMPLFVLEVCAGQFSGFGAVKVWNICPLFKGIGISTFMLITICAIYYNTIICWVIYFLIKSCAKVLPWSTCGNDWNSPFCWIYQTDYNTGAEETSNYSIQYYQGQNTSTVIQSHDTGLYNASTQLVLGENNTLVWKSPADEFWHNHVLDLSSGITNLDGLKWDLVGCLTLAWVIIFLCLCKGTQSLGKVVYVTAPLPYLLLSILLVRGVLLPGSLEGIKFYIIPDWSKLLHFKVWTEAALQVFYSIGPAWGTLFTMSSYNKFNSPCIRDAVSVSLMGAGTSFFAGFVIFSVIGFMAFKTGLPIKDVIASGPGLAFIAYPEAISRMPLSPFWAILFFLMLVIVGINSEMFFVETTINSIHGFFPRFLNQKKVLLVALLSLVFLLTGLVMCTRGGIYIFLVIDWYLGPVTPFVVGLLECIVIVYIYGHRRFYSDIELMLGHKPSVWWKISWGFICPIMLMVMVVYNLIALGEPYYRDYTYPHWVIVFGLVFASSSVIPIPVVMIKSILEQDGSFIERIKASLKPSASWGPSDKKMRSGYNLISEKNSCFSNLTICNKNQAETPDEKEQVPLNMV